MKYPHIFVACVFTSAASGLVAAFLWARASTGENLPEWIKAGRIEPLDPQRADRELILGLLQGATEAGRLNRRAAAATAIAAFFGAVASLLSLF